MTVDSPTMRGKSFDCVAFQREQRDRISRKLMAMTAEEQMDYLRNAEIKDPVLRRIWERSPRAKLLPLRPVSGSRVGRSQRNDGQGQELRLRRLSARATETPQ